MEVHIYKRGKRVPILSLLVAVFLSLLFTACGSTGTTTGGAPTPNPATPTIAAPANLLTHGTLTVGSDTTYPPMEFVDTTTNQYVGFDVDLITAMSQRMGLQTKIQKTGFDTIFDDLSNKRFDTVISSVTVNAERQKKFDFVPYFQAGESFLVPKGNPKNIKSTADVCGLSIGVQIDTVEKDDLDKANQDCKSAGKPEAKLTVLKDQTAVVQLLVNRRVDATYQDSPVTDYYNKINPGQFEVGGSVVNTAPYGVVVRKGDTAMLNALQAAFKSVKDDGTYDKLFDKWQLTKSQKI